MFYKLSRFPRRETAQRSEYWLGLGSRYRFLFCLSLQIFARVEQEIQGIKLLGQLAYQDGNDETEQHGWADVQRKIIGMQELLQDNPHRRRRYGVQQVDFKGVKS